MSKIQYMKKTKVKECVDCSMWGKSHILTTKAAAERTQDIQIVGEKFTHPGEPYNRGSTSFYTAFGFIYINYYHGRFISLQNLVFYCENVNCYELILIIYVSSMHRDNYLRFITLIYC